MRRVDFICISAMRGKKILRCVAHINLFWAIIMLPSKSFRIWIHGLWICSTQTYYYTKCFPMLNSTCIRQFIHILANVIEVMYWTSALLVKYSYTSYVTYLRPVASSWTERFTVTKIRYSSGEQNTNVRDDQ